jgi:asparagine synthetase B (glutamine-hydrolysing)
MYHRPAKKTKVEESVNDNMKVRYAFQLQRRKELLLLREQQQQEDKIRQQQQEQGGRQELQPFLRTILQQKQQEYRQQDRQHQEQALQQQLLEHAVKQEQQRLGQYQDAQMVSSSSALLRPLSALSGQHPAAGVFLSSSVAAQVRRQSAGPTHNHNETLKISLVDYSQSISKQQAGSA